jgi:glucose/mannose-6-phosphate isomerase
MANSLDDSELIRRLDPGGMLQVINAFPEYCLEAVKATEGYEISVGRRDFRNVVVAGMGGSAIGGTLLRDWLQPTCRTPIIVSKHYGLPAYVDGDTLLYAVSYSGNTEETLSALAEARKRGATVVAFTSGGKMLDYAKSKGFPCAVLPGGFQPRAAIPHQFFSLATVSEKLGLVGDAWVEVDEAILNLKKVKAEMGPGCPAERNTAKQIASQLKGFIPFVYGSSLHEGVAYRWNTQLNENGKVPASSSYFPEAFHNAVMASEGEPGLLRDVCVVIIHDPMEPPETAAKIGRFRGLVRKRFGRVIDIDARGTGRLSRILTALYIGDFVSAYLGILNGKNPSATASIDELKRG